MIDVENLKVCPPLPRPDRPRIGCYLSVDAATPTIHIQIISIYRCIKQSERAICNITQSSKHVESCMYMYKAVITLQKAIISTYRLIINIMYVQNHDSNGSTYDASYELDHSYYCAAEREICKRLRTVIVLSIVSVGSLYGISNKITISNYVIKNFQRSIILRWRLLW